MTSSSKDQPSSPSTGALSPEKSTKAETNFYPPWAPRFWNGMSASGYFSLLRENRFRVHPARWPMMGMVGGCSLINSTLNRIQRLFYASKIENVSIEKPPVFIVGHWRSGTTLLHELIGLDEARFAYPSNFEAFVPEHFLLTRHLMYPLVNLLLPGKRPMDAMSMNASSPQEDDFALCSYGTPTPYRRIAFPNNRNEDHQQLNPEHASVAPNDHEEVKQALTHFYKSLTLRYPGKQLVLKSPPHTGRIRQLAEWFPGAKFVHVARHPHKLVSSTMRLWSTLDQIQGLQLANYDDQWLKNYVFQCQSLMYESYFQHRDTLPPQQLAEVRFEELVKSPTATMQQIYDQLQLGDFETARPAVENYFQQRKNHRTNTVELDAQLIAEIDVHWRPYADAFGY